MSPLESLYKPLWFWLLPMLEHHHIDQIGSIETTYHKVQTYICIYIFTQEVINPCWFRYKFVLELVRPFLCPCVVRTHSHTHTHCTDRFNGNAWEQLQYDDYDGCTLDEWTNEANLSDWIRLSPARCWCHRNCLVLCVRPSNNRPINPSI